MLGAAQEAGARRFIHIGAEVALPILFPWVQAAGERVLKAMLFT